MPVPENERLKFFVYVVESPSAQDLYQRRSEGEIIQRSVNLNQIPCNVVTAINREMFEAALKTNITHAMSMFPGKIPILHISAHGFDQGIQLSSGEILSWAELRLFLAPINAALNNALVVCLSCCEGYAGTRMAMFPEDEGYPFYALVTNSEKPLWSDTAVAYTSFYHQMAKGEYIWDAVESMKAASGNHTFWFQTAEGSRQAYVNLINNIDSEKAQDEIEANNASEEPDHLAKLRKYGEQNGSS